MTTAHSAPLSDGPERRHYAWVILAVAFVGLLGIHWSHSSYIIEMGAARWER